MFDNGLVVLQICMGVVKSEPGSDTNGVPVPVTFEPENNVSSVCVRYKVIFTDM
jgi:phage terminase large subunit-like protein